MNPTPYVLSNVHPSHINKILFVNEHKTIGVFIRKSLRGNNNDLLCSNILENTTNAKCCIRAYDIAVYINKIT